jgi:hypothetical protein
MLPAELITRVCASFEIQPPLKWLFVNLPFTAIDHVQLAMPVGQEETARKFYAELLGMREIPKPAELSKRGGCWFESGSVQVHLGVEKHFRPAMKAHPAFKCTDYDGLVAKLRASGVEVTEPGGIFPGCSAATFMILSATALN